MVHLYGFRLRIVSNPYTLEKPDEQAYQVRTVGNHGHGGIVRKP